MASDNVAMEEVDFLLRYPVKPLTSPFPWLSDHSWGGISALSKMENFLGIDKDIESASKRYIKHIIKINLFFNSN